MIAVFNMREKLLVNTTEPVGTAALKPSMRQSTKPTGAARVSIDDAQYSACDNDEQAPQLRRNATSATSLLLVFSLLN